MRPLYVRLPEATAEKLDRASFESRTPKQSLIAQLVDDHLTVGRHAFFPREEPAVLTLEEAAELLRIDAERLAAMAEAGEVPGRRLGDEWRFVREALLNWLGNHDEEA